MKKYLATLIPLVTLVVAGLAMDTSQNQKKLLFQQNEEKRGTIAWYVKKAKNKKVGKVVLLPVDENPVIVSRLDDALAQYTAIIAQPIEKKSYVATEDSLMTWHRFKVLEVLSQPSKATCSGCLGELKVPSDLPLSLTGDEILVPTGGGSVIVDGVKVVSKDQYFSKHFLPSQKYLLFVSHDITRGVGKLRLGPYGVFAIDSEGNIRSIVSGETELKRDLSTNIGDSLNRLKQHIRER